MMRLLILSACLLASCASERGSYIYAASPSNNYLQQHCKLIKRQTNLYWCPTPFTRG